MVTRAVQPVPIGPEYEALIRRRVSIIAASRDAQNRPHLMRAIGCRLSDDRAELTLFMSSRTSVEVLADIRRNGQIAVVFSSPTTNRTLQLKGRDATVVPLAPGDEALVERYVDDFADEIAELGFAPIVAHTLFSHQRDEMVAVRFTPEAGFEQTPGPAAGTAIAGCRATT